MVNIAIQVNLQTLQYQDFQKRSVPQLRAIGQYPSGFQTKLGQKPAESDDGVWPLLPGQVDMSLRRSLLAGLHSGSGFLPLIYLQLRKGTGIGGLGHAMVLDLAHPGLFDPNFGLMSLRQGYNWVQLARLFQSMWEEYADEADGCIAYQLRDTGASANEEPDEDPDRRRGWIG